MEFELLFTSSFFSLLCFFFRLTLLMKNWDFNLEKHCNTIGQRPTFWNRVDTTILDHPPFPWNKVIQKLCGGYKELGQHMLPFSPFSLSSNFSISATLLTVLNRSFFFFFFVKPVNHKSNVHPIKDNLPRVRLKINCPLSSNCSHTLIKNKREREKTKRSENISKWLRN